MKRLVPLAQLTVAAAVLGALYYFGTPSDGNFQDSPWVLFPIEAALVTWIIGRAWAPKRSRETLVAAVLAAILNPILWIPFSHPAMWAATGITMFVLVPVGMPESAAFSALVKLTSGIISAACAFVYCLLLRMTDCVRGITLRAILICGLCVSIAGLPFDLTSALGMALHKFMWIALFGIGLTLSVAPERATKLSMAGSASAA